MLSSSPPCHQIPILQRHSFQCIVPILSCCHSHHCSCCCACCLWTILLLIALLLLAAIAGAVLWVLYRPHRPTFSVSSLRIKNFNVTSSQLNSNFDLTASARNPNKKIKFFYDPVVVSVYTSSGVDVGEGSFPAFVHGTKNTTLMKASLSSSGLDLDTASISSLRSDLKTKSRLTLKVRLETKVKVKMGGFKSNKVGIRVSCDGIQATVPTGKSPVTASTSDAKCKANLRIKIWKWTF